MRAKVKHIMFYISFNETDVSVYVVTTYYVICEFLGEELLRCKISKGWSFYDKERMKDLLAYDDLHPGSKRGNVSSSVVAGYALQ